LSRAFRMTRSPTASVRAARSSAAGENGSSKNDWEAWKTFPAPADPGFFPPELVVRVKAIACEFPAHVGEPLSRWSVAELGSHVRARLSSSVNPPYGHTCIMS